MLIEVHVLPLVVLFNVSNLSSFNKILTAYFTGWHLYYSSLSFSKVRRGYPSLISLTDSNTHAHFASLADSTATAPNPKPTHT